MKQNWIFRTASLFLILIAISISVTAQDYRYKGEVYGNVGIGSMVDDETHLGKGWLSAEESATGFTAGGGQHSIFPATGINVTLRGSNLRGMRCSWEGACMN